MGTNSTLQIGWFLDPLPQDLPVWVMVLGLEALFLGTVIKTTREIRIFGRFTGLERLLGVFGVGLGFFFATLSLFRTAYGAYAIYLYLLFRMLEGAAGVQIYRRLAHVFTTWSLPEGNNLGALVRHKLTGFFVIFIGIWIALQILMHGPFFRTLWYELIVVYTVVSFLLALMAVRWRLRKAQANYNVAIVYGLAMCIGGAQIFNFTLLEDIMLSLAGTVVYSVGFWVTAGLMTLQRPRRSESPASTS